MRKGRLFATAERAGEREGTPTGCRAVGPTVDTGQTPGPALLRTVLLVWDCATQSPVLPLFREAVGGPVTATAETTAILSTLCPPARKVCDFAAGAEYQQWQMHMGPYSIDQVKLINGVLFHRVSHKVFIAQGHLDSWNNLGWKELLEVIYSNLPNAWLSSKLRQVVWGLLSFENLQGQRFHNLYGHPCQRPTTLMVKGCGVCLISVFAQLASHVNGPPVNVAYGV